MSYKFTLAAMTASLSLSLANSAVAKGVGQAKVVDEIITTQTQIKSDTAISASRAVEVLKTIPGGIGFVEAQDYLDNFTQTIGDALIYTPGVYVDTTATRESRISIRGSGLNSSFERRGLTVLRDGVPISRASGSTEFQEIDPLLIDYIEVYKGANGLRFGAASLGGEVKPCFNAIIKLVA